MPVVETDLLESCVRLIEDKLRRVQTYLEGQLLEGRYEKAAGQFAVRLIKSRKRELRRVLALKTRTGSAWYRSHEELLFSRRDLGEQFPWVGRRHSIGRLDCPGCEYVMTDQGARQPLCRVCPACQCGAQHSAVVAGVGEAVTLAGQFGVAAGLISEGGGPHGAFVRDGGGILWICEGCGSWSLEDDMATADGTTADGN